MQAISNVHSFMKCLVFSFVIAQKTPVEIITGIIPVRNWVSLLHNMRYVDTQIMLYDHNQF